MSIDAYKRYKLNPYANPTGNEDAYIKNLYAQNIYSLNKLSARVIADVQPATFNYNSLNNNFSLGNGSNNNIPINILRSDTILQIYLDIQGTAALNTNLYFNFAFGDNQNIFPVSPVNEQPNFQLQATGAYGCAIKLTMNIKGVSVSGTIYTLNCFFSSVIDTTSTNRDITIIDNVLINVDASAGGMTWSPKLNIVQTGAASYSFVRGSLTFEQVQ